MKYPPHQNVDACVRAPGGRAWCGASIASDEFAFTDSGHALAFYDRTKYLQACPSCIREIKHEKVKDAAARSNAP
jgi:hypothetical protein